jgi:lipid A 3-O-deacylase
MTLGSKLRAGAGIAVLLAVAPAVRAQAPAPATADSASIWTLQGENAALSTAKLTDRYYVNGLRLGYTSSEGNVPSPLAGVASAMWDGGAVRVSFDLSQQIYTPNDTKDSVPPPGDRPYAGVLLGTLGLLRDVPDSRSMLSLSLGLIGPDAQAERLQNGFHDLIGQDHTFGWDSQIHDEPLIQFTSARTWRLSTGSVGPLETDVLPDLAFGLGNLRIYAQTGLVVRLGQGLDSDYGATRLAPGPSGWDAFKPTRPFAWYVFAGADGQAVAHDITINGNDFRDSSSATLRPFVGEFEGGVALMAFGARLTYTHVLQTQEITHQKGGLHQFGSLALSVRF